MTEIDKNTLRILQAAVGLAAIHFPVRSGSGTTLVSSRDVAFLLDGHVDIWSGWRTLDAPDTERVTLLLRYRRAEYADGEWARRTLLRMLDDGSLAGCRLDADSDEELLVSCAPGMSLHEYVDEALTGLREHSTVGRSCRQVAAPGTYRTTARRTTSSGNASFVDQHVQIRDYGRSAAADVPTLSTSAGVDDIRIPISELGDLAAKLDAADGRGDHYAEQIDRLCTPLRTKDGFVGVHGVLEAAAGETRLLNAPTGIGKSVLVEVLACWMAQKGLVLTVLVPSNAEILKFAQAIEDHLRALGIRGQVAPLMSPDRVFDVLRGVLRSRPAWDPEGLWTLGKLGYGCALSAVTEGEESVDLWKPGQEPCVRLTLVDNDRPRPQACPWRSGCGKFALARAALEASVIVTSHVNFHRGRVHLPVEDGQGTTDRTTVEELILRRSHLLVIDEIDSFQRSVIDQSARGLLLEERGRLETPLHTLENEFVLATGKLGRDVESSVRRMVHHTKFLTGTYVAALDHGLIGVTKGQHGIGRYWLVPRRWDGALTAQLWGLAEGEPLTEPMLSGFRSLFPDGDPAADDEPEEFGEIRLALAEVTEIGAAAARLETNRDKLDSLLGRLVPDDRERDRVVDRLLQRTVLEVIRGNLRTFVYDAPHLSEAGVPIAGEIAETFGPFSRWRAHPNGPLGRLLFAFRQQVDPTGRQAAKLSAAAFGGDPHTYTTTIGDITALCRAGVRRPVVGLSATAYFPGAPRHHVHSEPYWWVGDVDVSEVEIQPVRVIDGARQRTEPIKVSGLTGARRDQALMTMAERLWSQRLVGELETLAVEDPERARILLATTSYEGARLVAEGLLRAGADPQRICLAVRPTTPDIGTSANEMAYTTAPWRELRADQLEEFAALADADVLIAPLARVERGLNIIGQGHRSALGSIWLLVRPMPVVDEPTELLAHVNARPLAVDPNDRILAATAPTRPADTLAERVQIAGRYFEDIVTSYPYFRAMPRTVQLAVAAETINGLIQLVGRARRGGTSAQLYLADAAMLSGGPSFASLIAGLRDHWGATGELPLLQELYGTTLDAFFQFADREIALNTPIEGDEQC